MKRWEEIPRTVQKHENRTQIKLQNEVELNRFSCQRHCANITKQFQEELSLFLCTPYPKTQFEEDIAW